MDYSLANALRIKNRNSNIKGTSTQSLILELETMHYHFNSVVAASSFLTVMLKSACPILKVTHTLGDGDMRLKLEDWLPAYNHQLAEKCPGRWHGNTSGRYGKPATQTQLKNLSLGRKFPKGYNGCKRKPEEA